VDDQEEQGPDGTDDDYTGNDDDEPDDQQEHVASFHTDDGERYVTLASPQGTSLRNCEAAGDPSSGNAPAGVNFNYGLFGFTITGLGGGSATTVKLYLPPNAAPTTYYKFGPTPSDTTDHWYEFLYDGETGAEIDGNIVTLHFVDGKRGDDNSIEDGVIIDEGGPGTPAGGGSSDHACFIAVVSH